MKKHGFTTVALAALASMTGVAAFAGSANAQTTTTPAPASAPTVTTRWSGAPETREEDRRFRVNGRFMYDVASTDADCANTACTGTNESGIRSYARRAFLGVEGRLTEQWRYNVKFDLTPGGTKADDVYLEYAGRDWSFVVGNNNAIAPMEDRTSSLAIPFNERSFIMTAAGWGKRPGIAWLTGGGNWSFGASLQSQDALDTSDTAANGTESYFTAFRGTWAPIYQQTPDGVTLLHLGLSARLRENGDGNGNALNGTFAYSPGGLSNKQSNNAGVGAAEADRYLGAEVAFQYNAFGMEAEYGQVQTDDFAGNATQLGDADITGYFVDLFWSPTGESRSYRAADGSWGNVRPRRTLGSDGGIGHVMLSARYDYLDQSDTNFAANRNELTAYTLGATWVPLEHVKFQLNYSNTDIDYAVNAVGTRVDNSIEAMTLRTQFDW